MIGFYQPAKALNRRAVYSPGTGRKLGYFSNDASGQQMALDVDGKPVMRIIRWKGGMSPFTDAHACGGSWVPPSDWR